jgi:hypothetical protein
MRQQVDFSLHRDQMIWMHAFPCCSWLKTFASIGLRMSFHKRFALCKWAAYSQCMCQDAVKLSTLRKTSTSIVYAHRALNKKWGASVAST